MLQLHLESVWTLWQGIGMILSLPFAYLWLKRTFKKWLPSEPYEPDLIPPKFMISMGITLLIPLIVGETLAVIVSIIIFPEMSESILYRGFRYYLVAFCSLALVFSVVYLLSQRKRKERETLLHQIEEPD